MCFFSHSVAIAVKIGQAIPQSTASRRSEATALSLTPYLLRLRRIFKSMQRMGATGIEPMTSTVSR